MYEQMLQPTPRYSPHDAADNDGDDGDDDDDDGDGGVLLLLLLLLLLFGLICFLVNLTHFY